MHFFGEALTRGIAAISRGLASPGPFYSGTAITDARLNFALKMTALYALNTVGTHTNLSFPYYYSHTCEIVLRNLLCAAHIWYGPLDRTTARSPRAFFLVFSFENWHFWFLRREIACHIESYKIIFSKLICRRFSSPGNWAPERKNRPRPEPKLRKKRAVCPGWKNSEYL